MRTTIGTAADARYTCRTKAEQDQNLPNPGQAQFDQTRGCAVDFLRGFNSMAIVIELPGGQTSSAQLQPVIGGAWSRSVAVGMGGLLQRIKRQLRAATS